MSSVTDFGVDLLRTGDLDPVYVALVTEHLPRPMLARVCLAYWCFYHLGLACFIAERGFTTKKFWHYMQLAAANEGDPKPYPRGAERRHYRGAQAVSSMAELVAKYPRGAEQALEGFFAEDTEPTFANVTRAVQTHRGFGEWIAFKIADMGERVLGIPVDFSDCALGVYKDPRQGAAVAFMEWQPAMNREWEDHVGLQAAKSPWNYPITDDQLRRTIDHYVKEFRRRWKKGAPPYTRAGRPVNVQEIETIFCKYKSHLKGHYPMGKDTREIRHGLHGWGDLAESLGRHLAP